MPVIRARGFRTLGAQSITLGPGVRLNVSHRGAGSAWAGVLWRVPNTSGRRNASVNIPGTGVRLEVLE